MCVCVCVCVCVCACGGGGGLFGGGGVPNIFCIVVFDREDGVGVGGLDSLLEVLCTLLVPYWYLLGVKYKAIDC